MDPRAALPYFSPLSTPPEGAGLGSELSCHTWLSPPQLVGGWSPGLPPFTVSAGLLLAFKSQLGLWLRVLG